MKRSSFHILVLVLLTTTLLLSCQHADRSQAFSTSLQPRRASEGGTYKAGSEEFDEIIFIKRPTYTSSHYYTDFIDGMEEFEFGEDLGNIFILDLKTNKLRELVPDLRGGVFGRFDLSFDATRVVFDYKPSHKEGFRIWEVGSDGKGLKQLTFDPVDEKERIAKYWNEDYEEVYNKHTDDMHPAYLPDGGIIFTSTRCEYEILCDEGFLTTTVLHRMDGDGGNMEKLTSSPVSEFSPVCLSDGRILYSRWEYVDKGSTSIKALWSMNPDGSSSSEVYGNNINQPPTFIYGREIPGKSGEFLAIGAPHFPQSGIGTVIRINTHKNLRSRDPMTYLTPVDIKGEGGWMFKKKDRWRQNEDGSGGRLYMDPYPLDETRFLVSCKFDEDAEWNDPAAYGIYLLNEHGLHTEVYEDQDLSCWQAMPFRKRPTPPLLNALYISDYAAKNQALCIVTDIYQGMEGVERGSIKYLRINEQIPRPWGCNHFGLEDAPNYWDPAEFPVVAMDGAFAVRLQHGIVPVEADGSAFFTVPADRNIFFQALDKNFMEVQRERTYVNYRPGEVRACIGCHEKQDRVPSLNMPGVLPLALKRDPDMPGPQPGEHSGQRVLHYITDVQPVWDKHCIDCHNNSVDSETFSLEGNLTELFCLSYENLIEEEQVRMIYEDREAGTADGEYLPPFSLGAHASKLTAFLDDDHYGVQLSREEKIRVTTWMDSNGQYYGSYYGRRHIHHRDHNNFRPLPTPEQALSPHPPIPENKR